MKKAMQNAGRGVQRNREKRKENAKDRGERKECKGNRQIERNPIPTGGNGRNFKK